MSIIGNLNNLISKATDAVSGLSQKTNSADESVSEISPEMPKILRKAAADGAVLLKNDGVLPFAQNTCVSLFGRVQKDWFFVGYGSGGDVNRPYAVNLIDGIKNCDLLKLNTTLSDIYEKWCEKNPVFQGVWGKWPLSYPEMPLSNDIIQQAKSISDAAVIVIGRSSGEDRDCEAEKGSYYLTEDERNMLDSVCKVFDKTVVLLNTGGIIDMSWIEEYGGRIGTVMYVWQSGMESGNAVADLLCGKVNPSGRLTDTIAKSYNAYPSADNFANSKFNCYKEDIYVGYRYFETFKENEVLYPFGFGLSYTDFTIEYKNTKAVDGGFEISICITNTGNYTGKETAQIYLEKPCGKLGNPKMQLVQFAKTPLLSPGESKDLTLYIDFYQLASYDDCGSTNNAGAYVIEQGEYKLHLGNNVKNTAEIFTYYQAQTTVFEKLKQAAAPQESFDVFFAEEKDGKRMLRLKQAAKQKYDLGIRIMNNLPEDIPLTEDKGFKLRDVKSGKITMDEFVAQLDLDELEAITRGDYTMNSVLGASGNAGAFGGVTQSLRDKGIPAVTTTDGPSGIRLSASCSLLPIGTALASSFDTALVEEVYCAVSKEMTDRKSDVLLAPGMNIHRNPLCGRNFEYYSEDPYLTGKIGAAAVRGIQSTGVSACPKHFACNNQEFRRNTCDSRLSERALREIYLKGFEICIKEAKPKNIMTSYNKINGVWAHYHYDLCTTILRNEWKYEGNVMTDWWMKKSKSPEFPNIRDQAYRVRAQVDVLMPGGKRIGAKNPDGTLLNSFGKKDGITLGEMQRCAKNVLNFVIQFTQNEQ